MPPNIFRIITSIVVHCWNMLSHTFICFIDYTNPVWFRFSCWKINASVYWCPYFLVRSVYLVDCLSLCCHIHIHDCRRPITDLVSNLCRLMWSVRSPRRNLTFFFRSPMPCCESHSSTKLMARLVGVCSKDQVRSFHTRQIPISIEENLLVIIFSSPYRRSNLSSLRRWNFNLTIRFYFWKCVLSIKSARHTKHLWKRIRN